MFLLLFSEFRCCPCEVHKDGSQMSPVESMPTHSEDPVPGPKGLGAFGDRQRPPDSGQTSRADHK